MATGSSLSCQKNKIKDKAPTLVLSRNSSIIRSTSQNKSITHEAAKIRRKYKKVLATNKEFSQSNAGLKKQINNLILENNILKQNQLQYANFVRAITKVKPNLSEASNSILSAVEILCSVTKVFDELGSADDSNPVTTEVASSINIFGQIPIPAINLSKKGKGPFRRTLPQGLDTILEANNSESDMEDNEMVEVIALPVVEQEEVNQSLKIPSEAREKADTIVESTSVHEKTSTVVPEIAANQDELAKIVKTTECQPQQVALDLNVLLSIESLSKIDDTDTDLPPMLFTERDLDNNPAQIKEKTVSKKHETKKLETILSKKSYFAPLLEDHLSMDKSLDNDVTEIYHFQMPEKQLPSNERIDSNETMPKTIYEKETNTQVQKRISSGPSFVTFQQQQLVFATHRPKFSDAGKPLHEQAKRNTLVVNETNLDEHDMELTANLINKPIVLGEAEKVTVKQVKNNQNSAPNSEVIATEKKNILKASNKQKRKLSGLTDDSDSDNFDPDFQPINTKPHPKPKTKDKNFEFFVSKNKRSVPKNRIVKPKQPRITRRKGKPQDQPSHHDPNRVLDVFDLSHSLNKSSFVMPISPRPKKSQTTTEKTYVKNNSDEENDQDKTLTPGFVMKSGSKTKQEGKVKTTAKVVLESESSSTDEKQKTIKTIQKSSRKKSVSQTSKRKKVGDVPEKEKEIESEESPFINKANIEGVKKKLLFTKSVKKYIVKNDEPPEENISLNTRQSIPFENTQPSDSLNSEGVSSRCRRSRSARVNYALPSMKKKLRRE